MRHLFLILTLSILFAWSCSNGGTSSTSDTGVADTTTMQDAESCDDVGILCACVGIDCDDGDACTTDTCNESGECEHSALSCDDQNSCTTDSCLPETGCVYETLADGTACDDESVCTTEDVCVAGGICTGTPVVCEDEDLCTTHACDSVDGCIMSYNQADCDDGNPCTKEDRCNLGQCQGRADDCDDGDPCTVDSCEPGEGCVATLDYPSCAPSSWTCDIWRYGTNDGCDCDCGERDPDCDLANGNTDIAARCGVHDAQPDQICNTWGRCVSTDWLPSCDPNDYNEGMDLSPGATAEFVCPPFQLPGQECDDGFTEAPSCECNCGAYDPDCVWSNQNDCSNPDFSCNPISGVCELPGWDADKCGPAAYKYDTIAQWGFDSGCDCECGVYDPDCDAVDNLVYPGFGSCGRSTCYEDSDCPLASTCNQSNDFSAEGPVPCAGAEGCYCSEPYLAPIFTQYHELCEDHDDCSPGAFCTEAGKCSNSNLMVCAKSGHKCVPDKWILAGCDPLKYNEGIKTTWVDLGPLGGYPFTTYPVCDCGCGIKDPDCDIINYDLALNQIPANNTCPTEGATCIGDDGACQLEGWTCNPANFDANDGCHCGCGTWDPDCDKDGDYPWQNAVYCAKKQLIMTPMTYFINLPGYTGGLDDPHTCDPGRNICIPEAWTCPADQYNATEGLPHGMVLGSNPAVPPEGVFESVACEESPDYLCHCNCGTVDPDCITNFQMSGYEGYTVNCLGKCDGSPVDQWELCHDSGYFAGQCMPKGLSEEAGEKFGEGEVCHCNLGAHDPDCDLPGIPVQGCPEGYRCVDGECNNRDRRAKVLFIHGRNDGTPPGGFQYWENTVSCMNCPNNPACYPGGDAFCEKTGTCTPGDCQWTPSDIPGFHNNSGQTECCAPPDNCDPEKEICIDDCEVFPLDPPGPLGIVDYTKKDFCDFPYLAAKYMADNPDEVMEQTICDCPIGLPMEPNIAGECSSQCELTTQPFLPWDKIYMIRGWVRECHMLRNTHCANSEPLDDPWIVPQVGNFEKRQVEITKHNIPVNWDGQSRIAWSQQIIVDALDQHCTGNSYCYIYTHSTGGLHIGNAIANWGNVKRWNIVKVFQSASAEGGSEIADTGLDYLENAWLGLGWGNEYENLCASNKPAPGLAIPRYTVMGNNMYPVDCDLRVQSARSLYNHNLTWGVPFAHAAGHYPSADESFGFTEVMLGYFWWLADLFTLNMNWEGTLQDEHDGAVPFHSSCGCRDAKGEDNVLEVIFYDYDIEACSECEQWEGHTWELEEYGLGFGHNGGMRRITKPNQSEYGGPGPWERWKAQVQYATSTYWITPQPWSGETDAPDECSSWESFVDMDPQNASCIDPDGNLWIEWWKWKTLASWDVGTTVAYEWKGIAFNAGNVGNHRWGPTMTGPEDSMVQSESWHIPGNEVCDCVDNDFDGVIDNGISCNLPCDDL